jgi:ABC-type transport system involved in multi-copper enzyme maturation permease subunit
MSTMVQAERIAGKAQKMAWSKWARQTGAVCALDLRRSVLSKRSFFVYLLAILPVLLAASLAAFPRPARELRDVSKMLSVRANIFDFHLRTLTFFGSAWAFMNLFRGEILDRSLHYYFLTPVRREVLVAGKFLSAAVMTIALFGLTTFGMIAFFYLPMGSGAAVRHLAEDGGLGQAFAYLSITALSCVGYGAIFLAIGLFFRNPIIPALIVYGWEFISIFLPPLLKMFGVTYYLTSLSPVPISNGPFSVRAEPMPPWVAVPMLLGFSLAVLAFSARRTRRMEIDYGSDT